MTTIDFFVLPGYAVGAATLAALAGDPSAHGVAGVDAITVVTPAASSGLPAQCPTSPCSSGVLAVGQITSATDVDTYNNAVACLVDYVLLCRPSFGFQWNFTTLNQHSALTSRKVS